jgi:LPXTG-site transpeptidase (sortase) family protein
MQTVHVLPDIDKISVSPIKRKIYKIYQYFGLSLTSFAIAGFVYSYSGDITSPELSNNPSPRPTPQTEVIDSSNKAQPVASGYEVADEANSYGVTSKFAVVIPKIKAYSNIIPQVPVNDKDKYMDALKIGVAQAKDSSFPGQGSTIYLFSHSTDSVINVKKYNAVFYDLKNLEIGDEIIVYYNHKKYIYQVAQKEIISPKDTSWLSPRDEETLILQTCYPPGTTWKRLLILAKPV